MVVAHHEEERVYPDAPAATPLRVARTKSTSRSFLSPLLDSARPSSHRRRLFVFFVFFVFFALPIYPHGHLTVKTALSPSRHRLDRARGTPVGRL